MKFFELIEFFVQKYKYVNFIIFTNHFLEKNPRMRYYFTFLIYLRKITFFL